MSLNAKNCPTKRAPDAGESGAIPSLFLRLNIFPVGRRPAARPSAGNANRWKADQKPKAKPSLNRKFRFSFGLKSRFVFMGWSFFGGAFWQATPCEQFIGFPNLVSSFQFQFQHWSKFWSIVVCCYLAYFLVKSFLRRFFSSVAFRGWFFQGFHDCLGFVEIKPCLVKSGIQKWLGFFGKGFGKFQFGSWVKSFSQKFGVWVLVLAKE